MDESEIRNPDADFVLHGKKEAIRTRDDEYLTNSQRTISTKNLSSSLNLSQGKGETLHQYSNRPPVPNIEDLERSIYKLKMDLKELNDGLQENYGKSQIFLGDDLKRYIQEDDGISDTEDPELTHLLQRHDEESVSHLPGSDSDWFNNPHHKTKRLGDYSTLQGMGVSKRSVSPINRKIGRLGAEIATKDVAGALTSVDVASNNTTFPVRLAAPHIVGVKSLLPPQFPVRPQDRGRAHSPRARSRSVEPPLSKSLTFGRRGRSRSQTRSYARDRSPLPKWMPTSKHVDIISKAPPPFKQKRGRSLSRKRPSTAPGARTGRIDLSQSLPLTTGSFGRTTGRYVRPRVQPEPSGTELSFLRSADHIDTRRALVENSPYQQELARLRLERLRVEEEYLLQLKRESELERIRGPKPKWYAMKGPQFHYECNKNTALHKNSDHWEETMRYRNHLLEVSREFAANMKAPVPALE